MDSVISVNVAPSLPPNPPAPLFFIFYLLLDYHKIHLEAQIKISVDFLIHKKQLNFPSVVIFLKYE